MVLLAGVGPSLSGCATNPATGSPELVFMSEEEELKIGRELHQQVLKQIPLYEDPALQAYVQEIGDRVSKSSHRSDLFYRFHVLDRPEVNAFALPGGYIYIFRGLLAYLNSEAELAAVLGHEVAHVTARHAVRQHRNAMLAQILATAVAIQAGGQAGDLSNILGNALIRGYGRELELEADRLGAEYLAGGGYDIEAMLQLIDVLKWQEEFEKERAKEEGRDPAVYHGVFSSHPRSDERLQGVVRAAQRLQESATPAVSREAYLARIEGLVFGTSARDGVQRGRNFYHQEFDIAFTAPESWRLQNDPQRVLLYAPKGVAKLQLSAQDLNKRVDGAKFARERLKLKGLTDERNFELNGMPVYMARYPESVLASSRHIHLAIIYAGERAFIFQAANKASDQDYALAAPFEAVVKSFHRLKSEEQALTEPLRFRSLPVKAGDSYESLAQRAPLGQDAVSLLRLFNHHYPNGEPAAGQIIKVVK
ncbi:MAG: M48 family metalloprotease [Nevskiales bacterium]